MATVTVNVSDAMLEELSQVLKSGGRPGMFPGIPPGPLRDAGLAAPEPTSLQRVTDHVVQTLKSLALSNRQRLRDTEGATADKKDVDQAFS